MPRRQATTALRGIASVLSNLLLVSLTVVFIFMVFGKVFSMQYLIWLCPLVPLITGRWRVPLAAVLFVAGGLSQFLYPYNYINFELFRPYTIAIMAARNFLMLVCCVLVLLPGGGRPFRRRRRELMPA